jgi:methyltransferase
MRLVELRISNRNVRRLLAAGGTESGAGHYPVMVLVHTLWLVSCIVEVVALERRFIPLLGGMMIVLLAGTTALRYWVIQTLGPRWTTRVITVQGAPRIITGPFRWLRHPNYLAVALEVVALPLIHSAWMTALVFGLANLLVLRIRIQAEDRALEANA